MSEERVRALGDEVSRHAEMVREQSRALQAELAELRTRGVEPGGQIPPELADLFDQISREFERLREQDEAGRVDPDAHARFHARARALARQLAVAHARIHRRR